ncbi:MAG: hypothetical protein DRO73_00050 [Candidatus Thorarchaeota archaeon]|nr:MAG: hypothetical protein DRO73_00050 [Candidatus Thorarchaeota archaeon]
MDKYKSRVQQLKTMFPRVVGRRITRFLLEYWLLFVVLALGLYVWVEVFRAALTDYLDSSVWVSRMVWLGKGEFQLFGYTVQYQLEGYSDYSFYYVHWGNNMLNGILPYCEEFGHIELEGVTNNNGLYIFPPLYALLYAAGVALNLDGYWGIGLLLAAFGYLTALPTYGIAKELSGNRHVGEAAALTYLLNPNVLYHIDFAWLNPSPFIFFFFLGFYFLVKNHRHLGTVSIVVAALFKQTAWFLGFPLVVYLLIRPRPMRRGDTQDTEDEEIEKEPETQKASQKVIVLLRRISSYFDLRGFAQSTLLVLIIVGIVMAPFIIAQGENVLFYMSLAAGGFPLESFTDPPGYGMPIRLQVLPVMAGMPELAQALDTLVYDKFLLTLGVVLFLGLMVIEPRPADHPRRYMRRLLYLTLLLMLWVHLTGPRGVFKYYFTLFAPFFSILSSTKMVTSKEETVGFSVSMLWLPIALSLLILLPDRNVYLAGVIIIFVGYVAADAVGAFWNVLTAPLRWLGRAVTTRLRPVRQRVAAWWRGVRPHHNMTVDNGPTESSEAPSE